ncbi:MAG: HD domain-containing protein [Deltaproteobacteria bacterium]|nr:HD domain-containing protein [Deltaproteobacteria bacterium]
MSKLMIRDLKDNEQFETAVLVLQKSTLMSKANKPYLSVKVMDASGEMEARVWDHVEELGALFDKEDFVLTRGKAVLYQEKMQLSLISFKKLNPDDVNISDFLPTTKKNIEEMFLQFMGLIQNKIENPWIKKFLLAVFEDPRVQKKFKRAPAAKTNHHAWIGGLLEHVLHLCELAGDVLKYYPQVNADLVYTGLMMHDLGKIDEMFYDRGFGYTDEGQLVGHLIQGVELVYDKIRQIENFPPKIKTHIVHLILAHHGKLEFGSPKLPMTLEAIMVHYLDDLDSKIQGVMDLAAKENNGNSWVSFNRLFGRPMYKDSRIDLEEDLKPELVQPQKNEVTKTPAKALGRFQNSLGEALKRTTEKTQSSKTLQNFQSNNPADNLPIPGEGAGRR